MSGQSGARETFVAHDVAVTPSSSSGEAAESGTLFSLRHLDALRKIFDEATNALRFLLAGALYLPNREVRIKVFHTVATNPGAASEGRYIYKSIPRTEHLGDEGLSKTISTSEEFLEEPLNNYDLGVLLKSWRGMFASAIPPPRYPQYEASPNERLRAEKGQAYHDELLERARAADKLRQFFKAFQHKGLFFQRDLHARLAHPDTCTELRRLLDVVLDWNLIDRVQMPEEPRRDIQAGFSASKRVLSRLFGLFRKLPNPSEELDSWESTAEKLELVATELGRPDRGDVDFKFAIFATACLRSRFEFRDLKNEQQAPAKEAGGAAPPGFVAPASTEALEGVTPSHHNATFGVKHNTSYFLPDEYSVYTVDVLNRAMDLFTVALAGVLSDKNIPHLYQQWSEYFVTDVVLVPFTGRLSYPIFAKAREDDRGNKIPAGELRGKFAAGDHTLPPHFFDPNVTVKWLVNLENSFGSKRRPPNLVKDALERLIILRNSLAHQTHSRRGYRAESLKPALKDFADVLTWVQSGANPDAETNRSLIKFRDFETLVREHFGHFSSRRKEGLVDRDGTTRRSEEDIKKLIDDFHLVELVQRLKRTKDSDQGTRQVLRAVLQRIQINRPPPAKDKKKKAPLGRFAALMADGDSDNSDDE
jgi:hypothetical protein